MTVIDAHAHLWQRERTPQPWIDPVSMAVIDSDFWLDDLVGMQQRAGIDGAILVQSSNTLQETRDLLRLAGAGPVLGVVGWIDLERDVPGQLAALDTEHLVGIRHLAHQDPDPAWLARPGLDFASLGDLPFDLVLRAGQLPIAVRTVADNPGTTFVLDHLGNPPIASGDLHEWSRSLARLAELDNIVVKLSGITPQDDRANWSINDLREPVETGLSLFGPRRILFGSDWPLVEIASDAVSWVAMVRELIPAEHHRAVFSENTQRVYSRGTHA